MDKSVKEDAPKKGGPAHGVLLGLFGNVLNAFELITGQTDEEVFSLLFIVWISF